MKAKPVNGRHTLAQVAKVLGRTYREVLAAIHCGPLVAERDGRRLYVWGDSLQRYVRGMR